MHFLRYRLYHFLSVFLSLFFSYHFIASYQGTAPLLRQTSGGSLRRTETRYSRRIDVPTKLALAARFPTQFMPSPTPHSRIISFPSPHSYLCFFFSPCVPPHPSTTPHPSVRLSLIDLSVGCRTLRRLSDCPGFLGGGKSINFFGGGVGEFFCLMCFFSFSRHGLCLIYRRREESPFLCLQWSWSSRNKVVAISLQSRKTCFFDLLLFLLH